MANKVRMMIAGSEYVISTEEDPKYTLQLARRLDEELSSLMDKNNITLKTALVLCAISYLDEAEKSNQCANNFRAQIKEYLEEGAKSRIEANEARREIERLKALLKVNQAEEDAVV